MFFLPWWTYVLIGTVAFTCSFGAVWLAGVAFDRETPDDGPFPCGEHLGTARERAEDWCWQVAGHDGDHLGMRQEWPVPAWVTKLQLELEDEPLPDLPQRVGTLHNDPWPFCPDRLGRSVCLLPQGHPQNHEYS